MPISDSSNNIRQKEALCRWYLNTDLRGMGEVEEKQVEWSGGQGHPAVLLELKEGPGNHQGMQWEQYWDGKLYGASKVRGNLAISSEWHRKPLEGFEPNDGCDMICIVTGSFGWASFLRIETVYMVEAEEQMMRLCGPQHGRWWGSGPGWCQWGWWNVVRIRFMVKLRDLVMDEMWSVEDESQWVPGLWPEWLEGWSRN